MTKDFQTRLTALREEMRSCRALARTGGVNVDEWADAVDAILASLPAEPEPQPRDFEAESDELIRALRESEILTGEDMAIRMTPCEPAPAPRRPQAETPEGDSDDRHYVLAGDSSAVGAVDVPLYVPSTRGTRTGEANEQIRSRPNRNVPCG